MNYGYDFFMRALNKNSRIEFEFQRMIALAVRTARNADKTEWSKYIRRRI